MPDQRSEEGLGGGGDWRQTLEERTSHQEAKRRRDGRLLVRMLAILLLAAAALVLVPAENRALLQGLWTNPPVLEAGPAPANPDEAVRQLFGTPPPAPAEGGSPAGTSEADPLIDQGDIRLAVELMDFIRPHGSGTDGVEEKPKP